MCNVISRGLFSLQYWNSVQAKQNYRTPQNRSSVNSSPEDCDDQA